MIKQVFQNIQKEILHELFHAEKSIKLAVAWFTSDNLFQALLLKQKTGVKVELIINDDDINRNRHDSLDFSLLQNYGGIIHWIPRGRLMHQKFCIIDERTVINGSYNWTNKAEYNNENISIYENEIEIVHDFNQEFKRLQNLTGVSFNKTIPDEDFDEYTYDDDSFTAPGEANKKLPHDSYSQDGRKLLQGGSSEDYYIIKNGTVIVCDNCQILSRKGIIFPSSVKALGYKSFALDVEGYYYNKFVIPKSIKYINNNPFTGCSRSPNFELVSESPDYVVENNVLFSKERIILHSFMRREMITGSSCKWIDCYKIPSEVKIIAKGAFAECYHIKQIILSPKTEEIREDAFYNCSNVKIWILPASLKSIQEGAFNHFSNESMIPSLKYVCIQSKIDKINSATFQSKTKFVIYTQRALVNYYKKVFEGFEIIGFPDDAFVDNEGVIRTKNTVIKCLDLNIKEYKISKGITSIGECAFRECKELETIDFCDVSYIEERAFEACSKLKYINLPQSVVSIGKSAFECSGLELLTIPDSVKNIDECAFHGCSIKSLKIGKGIERIAHATFLFNTLNALIIPSNVKIIENSSFSFCELEDVIFEEGVYKIEDDAFEGNKLQEVILPKSVRMVSAKAFDISTKISYN